VVSCTHCVELSVKFGEVACPECGLTGVPMWDDEHPDGTRYTIPNHSTPRGPRCHGSFSFTTVEGTT
jgi:hypothetical protein